jgi:hypothetical protein
MLESCFRIGLGFSFSIPSVSHSQKYHQTSAINALFLINEISMQMKQEFCSKIGTYVTKFHLVPFYALASHASDKPKFIFQ